MIEEYFTLAVNDSVVLCYSQRNGKAYITPQKALEAARNHNLRGVFKNVIVPCLRYKKSINPDYYPYKDRVYKFNNWMYDICPVLCTNNEIAVSLVGNLIVIQKNNRVTTYLSAGVRKGYIGTTAELLDCSYGTFIHVQSYKGFPNVQAVFNEVLLLRNDTELFTLFVTDDSNFDDLAKKFCCRAESDTSTFELQQKYQYNRFIIKTLQKFKLAFKENKLMLDDYTIEVTKYADDRENVS